MRTVFRIWKGSLDDSYQENRNLSLDNWKELPDIEEEEKESEL